MKRSLADTRKQQERALDVLNALHECDFRSLWLESVVMFRGEARSGEVMHSHLRVVVESAELRSDQLNAIYQVAEEMNARVSLVQVQGVNGHSRISVYPRTEEDDA